MPEEMIREESTDRVSLGAILLERCLPAAFSTLHALFSPFCASRVAKFPGLGTKKARSKRCGLSVFVVVSLFAVPPPLGFRNCPALNGRNVCAERCCIAVFFFADNAHDIAVHTTRHLDNEFTATVSAVVDD